MSDMSNLSHEYALTTDFSHHVNQAVLLLKKRYLGGSEGIDAKRFAKASKLVGEVVCRLLRRMGAAVEQDEIEGPVLIPEDVLIRLQEKYRGNLAYFMDDLTKLNKLLKGGSNLSPADLELLDSICDVADASASATFRKLWRR